MGIDDSIKTSAIALVCLGLGLPACGTGGGREDESDSNPGTITLGPGGPGSSSDGGTAGTMGATNQATMGGTNTAPGTADETADEGETLDPPKFDTNEMPDADTGGGCECGGDLQWSYVWVANSNESTVSKIDTTTLTEEGRYYTEAAAAGNPSRTSVSLTADAVAVANRNGGVTKVWARSEFCDPLRNGVPGVQTSTGAADLLPFAQDDCIAWNTDFNYSTQRPVAWTSGVQDPASCEYEDTAVWTSGCTIGADANVWVHLLDGDTGVSLADIQVAGFPCTAFGAYGGAVDSNNDFWISNNDANSLIARIRLSDFSTEVVSAPYHPYGIAVDGLDRVWLTINNVETTPNVAAQRYDPATGVWDIAMGATITGFSGIQEGADGVMWLNYGYGGAIGLTSIDRDTLVVGPQIPIPGAATWLNGISIDPDGNVWTVSPGANSVFRYDPGTGLIDSYGGLNYPYTYSDMTGSGLQNSACGSPVG